MLPKLNADQAQRYQKAYDDLAQGIRSGSNQLIMTGINETDAVQH